MKALIEELSTDERWRAKNIRMGARQIARAQTVGAKAGRNYPYRRDPLTMGNVQATLGGPS